MLKMQDYLRPRSTKGRFGQSATLASWTLIALILTAGSARAQDTAPAESLGRLEVADIFLEPTYGYREFGHAGSFDLGTSYMAIGWTRDAMISSVLKLGAPSLIGRPARFATTVTSESVAVFEGYIQVNTDYGRVRFGMIPIPFGLEGGDVERHLSFPRSQLFQARYLVLRDYGFGYHIANEGFFSDWALHNGEGGSDLDNEIWFTARLGWQSHRSFRLGFSGSTGRSNQLSTDPQNLGNSKLPAAWIDVDQPARYRIVNLFVEVLAKPLHFETEATAGEAVQGESVIKTRALHADLEVDLGKGPVRALARYDLMSPRNDVAGNQVFEYSAGLAWHSRYDNSVLSLIGTKKVVENVSQDDHRVLVVWRVTPVAGALAGDTGI